MRIVKQMVITAWTATVLILSQQGVPAEEASPSEQPQPGAPTQETQPSAAPQQAEANLFPEEQLEELVAPIALYPDALLAQVLMASTYPLDVVQASRWLKDNAELEGEALEEALEGEPWDPSVKTLVFFPDVIARMNDNLDWTQDLGDAFLAQEADLMAAVQQLREDAQEAGNLASNEHQTVTTEESVIVVEPSEPEVVYVPTYDPSAVYGSDWQPTTNYYPTVYTQPTTTYVESSSTTSNLVSFGAGMLVGGLLVAAIDWGRRDYYRGGIYYPPRYRGWGGYYGRDVNITRNVRVGDVNIDRSRTRWEHNAERRGGVRYRNETTRNRYEKVGRTARIDRDVARGFDRSARRVDRKRTAGTRQARPEARKAAGDRVARDRASQVDRRARSGTDQARLQRSTGEARKAAGDRAKRPSAASRDRASASRKTVNRASADRRASAFQSQNRSGNLARSASNRGSSSRAARRDGTRRSGGGQRSLRGGRG